MSDLQNQIKMTELKQGIRMFLTSPLFYAATALSSVIGVLTAGLLGNPGLGLVAFVALELTMTVLIWQYLILARRLESLRDLLDHNVPSGPGENSKRSEEIGESVPRMLIQLSSDQSLVLESAHRFESHATEIRKSIESHCENLEHRVNTLEEQLRQLSQLLEGPMSGSLKQVESFLEEAVVLSQRIEQWRTEQPARALEMGTALDRLNLEFRRQLVQLRSELGEQEL